MVLYGFSEIDNSASIHSLPEIPANHIVQKVVNERIAAECVCPNMELLFYWRLIPVALWAMKLNPEPALNNPGLELYSHEPLKESIKKSPGDCRQENRLRPAHPALNFQIKENKQRNS